MPLSNIYVVGQNLESSLLRVPLRFARQQLPQLLALQPKQACSIPAQLVLLPPGIRDPSFATKHLSLPGGLCIVRYDFLKEGHQSKFEYRSHGFVQAHSQCKQICQDAWFLVGLAMSAGVLQLLCSQQLPTAEMEQRLHGNQQRKRSRELSLQLRQSDDLSSAEPAGMPAQLPAHARVVSTDLERLQENRQQQQYLAQHHAAALQEWQLQDGDSMQEHRRLRPLKRSSSAGPESQAQMPNLLDREQEQEQHSNKQQETGMYQQEHPQQKQLQHQDSLNSEPGQLPPRLRPALNIRLRAQSLPAADCSNPDTPSHASSNKKRVRWADNREFSCMDPCTSAAAGQVSTPASAPPLQAATSSELAVPTKTFAVCIPAQQRAAGQNTSTAAAAEQHSSTQAGMLPMQAAHSAELAIPLWQHLLLLQQLQQLAALSVVQLQQLLDELSALDGEAPRSSSSSAGCQWSGHAGSCAGSSCCSSHLPDKPSAGYQQRSAILQRYGIQPGAAGQYHVQLQHMEAALTAMQAPMQTHGQLQQAHAVDQPPHGQVQQPQASCAQHCADLPVQHGTPAVDTDCSEMSAHTCDSANGPGGDCVAAGVVPSGTAQYSFTAAQEQQQQQQQQEGDGQPRSTAAPVGAADSQAAAVHSRAAGETSSAPMPDPRSSHLLRGQRDMNLGFKDTHMPPLSSQQQHDIQCPEQPAAWQQQPAQMQIAQEAAAQPSHAVQAQETAAALAPAPSAAAAAPVWPLPIPQHGMLTFDWPTHSAALQGIAAAAPELGRQSLVPVTILQHQPGRQHPVQHHVLALGRLTQTDFRMYGGAFHGLLEKLGLCGSAEVTNIYCPTPAHPTGSSCSSSKRLPCITLEVQPSCSATTIGGTD